MRSNRSERGFTLIEIVIVLFIMGLISTGLMQMMQTWSKATVRMAVKERQRANESDMRRLYQQLLAKGPADGTFPTFQPWPETLPVKTPVPWIRPAPGYDSVPWAPSKSPLLLQYRVDGWSSGFIVSAIGDLDLDGSYELYRLDGTVGLFEGPMAWPPASEVSSPLGSGPGSSSN